MDVYEEEFGDLLHARRRTAYEQFYAKNIKTLVTKYHFLPAELIECRMQSMWNRCLARNPLLRKKHESEVEATRLLLSKGKRNRTRQRKSRKNVQAGRRRLPRRSQTKAECLTDSDESDQSDIFHTPLPGFRRKKRTTVKDRYRPLDIQVTRTTPAQIDNRRRVVLSDQSSEESSDGANNDENDLPPEGQDMTADSSDSMSEQPQPSDEMSDQEEVRNKRLLPTSKHSTTIHGILTHSHDTPLKQGAENKFKTATAITKTDKLELAKTFEPTCNTAHSPPVDLQVSVNSLAYLEHQRHGGERPQHEENYNTNLTASMVLGAIASQFESCRDPKLDETATLKSMVQCFEQESHNALPMADKKKEKSMHFLSQTTVSISPRESENEKNGFETSETSSSTDDWSAVAPGQADKSTLLKSADLSAMGMHKKATQITSPSQESSKHFIDYRTMEAGTELLETLHEHDNSQRKLVPHVQSKARQNITMQPMANSTTLTVKSPAHDIMPKETAEKVQSAEPHNENNTKNLSDTMSEQNANEPHKTVSILSVETSVEKQRCKQMSNERPQQSCLKVTKLKSVENVQPGTIEHVSTKNSPRVLESTSSQHKRRGTAAKTKLSLKYLMQANKNNEEHAPADMRNERQQPNSPFQHNLKPMTNIDTSESEEDVQKNVAVRSDAQKRHQICEQAVKKLAATNTKLPRVASIGAAQSKDAELQELAKMHEEEPKKQTGSGRNSEPTAESKSAKSTIDARRVYFTGSRAQEDEHKSYEIQKNKTDSIKDSRPKDIKGCAERNNAETIALVTPTAALKDKTNHKDAFQKKKSSNEKARPAISVTSSEHRQEAEKKATIEFVASEVQKGNHKGNQNGRTSSCTKAVVSMKSAESRKYAKNATESPHLMKLRDRKVASTERHSMSKAKVPPSVNSTCGEVTMKLSDDEKTIAKKNGRLHHTAANDAGMPVELKDKLKNKDIFKTPKPLKKIQRPCPPTPLKHRVLKENIPEDAIHQNDDARLFLAEELQCDPETPFGSKTRFTKHGKNDSTFDRSFQSHYENSQMEWENEVEEEMKPINEEGQQIYMKGAKHQVLSHNPRLCAEDPNTKKTTDVTSAPDSSMKNARGKRVTFSIRNMDSKNPVLPSNPLEGAETTVGEEHHGTNDEDIEMTSVRSSNDYRGLTQHPNPESERQKVVQGQLLTKKTQQHVASEMELDEDDDLLCLTQRMSQLQSCSLYSQNEASRSSAAMRTVGSAFERQPSEVSVLVSTKQKADGSNGKAAGIGEHDTGFKERMPKEDTESACHVIRETQFEADDDDEDAYSILFGPDDDKETSDRGGSQSFFQIKITPTPLNFLKSPDDGNESDSDEELFPWLVDKPQGSANKRKGKPLPCDVPHDDSTGRPSSKRLCLQQGVSASHLQGHNNSSECSKYPPLLSRREAQYFGMGGDEDYSED